ncbi:MAG: ATP-binding protein [Planctomycetota bacterium]
MNDTESTATYLSRGEDESVEYKAVLPPSKSIARILCGLANTHGGALILGVDGSSGNPNPVGLSRDFHAHEVTSKAVTLLVPSILVQHRYVDYDGNSLYLIEVAKSDTPVTVEGKAYSRSGTQTVASQEEFRPKQSCESAEQLAQKLARLAASATESKTNFVEHYLSILRIINDLGSLMFPVSSDTPTDNREERILTRILFSSAADTFEGYLSDLLYEIYLANPNTLKSNEAVTVKDVLDCADLREFIDSWARRKLAKLERGSVKGFIAENKQIRDLAVIEKSHQDQLEKILQIRHLYTHKNGIADEKFLKYFPSLILNDEHRLSVDQMVSMFDYLASTVNQLDVAAIGKYRLATLA